MDADGLPLVGPGLDFTKIEAINQKRIIAFVNHFLSHTVQFLNHFAVVCEEKLANINIKIQRLEATASILETKLSYIPGLENVTAPTTSVSQAVSSETPSTAYPDSYPDTQPAAPTGEGSSGPTEQQVEEIKPELTVSKDPRYMKFFKLLQVGVPLPAVKQKVAIDGLDPSLLDTPNAPAPPAGAKKPQSNSDGEFSEKSEESEDDADW